MNCNTVMLYSGFLLLLLPACLIAQTTTTSSPTKYCFPPSFGNNGKCFEHIEQTFVSHTAADELCALQFTGMNGRLAAINNAYENNAVQLILNTPTDTDLHPWIGAIRDDSGNFQWMDGSSWAYNNWMAGEPLGDCGQVCRVDNQMDLCQKGKWKAVQCVAIATFICEYYPNGGGPMTSPGTQPTTTGVISTSTTWAAWTPPAPVEYRRRSRSRP